jgi:2Fe-2S ferredoxin
MIKITFIDQNDKHYQVTADIGSSVMEAAVNNDVQGIDAECGGCCACATCHVVADDNSWLVVGAPETDEDELLDCVDARQARSRLSCQITVDETLDGACFYVP